MIRWENPPEAKQGPSKYVELGIALKARPGKWALVATKKTAKQAGSIAQTLRVRYGLEAVSRGTKVYARWPAKVTKVAAARKPRRKK